MENCGRGRASAAGATSQGAPFPHTSAAQGTPLPPRAARADLGSRLGRCFCLRQRCSRTRQLSARPQQRRKPCHQRKGSKKFSFTYFSFSEKKSMRKRLSEKLVALARARIMRYMSSIYLFILYRVQLIFTCMPIVCHLCFI